MVDAIKTTVNRLELTKGRASEGRPANAGTPAVPASQMVDDVRVSDAASVNTQMQIAQTPLSITKPLAGLKKPLNVVNIRLMLS